MPSRETEHDAPRNARRYGTMQKNRKGKRGKRPEKLSETLPSDGVVGRHFQAEAGHYKGTEDLAGRRAAPEAA